MIERDEASDRTHFKMDNVDEGFIRITTEECGENVLTVCDYLYKDMAQLYVTKEDLLELKKMINMALSIMEDK